MTNTMYIGPTVRGVVKHGAAFSGGLPARVEKLADAKPIIKNLIVPVSDLADAVRRSNEEGSAVAVAYDRISELTEAEIRKIMEGV
ncbi:MAG: hypothetical protein HFG80_10695 [Eubacterium sp.]|nr:hypothetical protein [Eubacterium sp.]